MNECVRVAPPSLSLQRRQRRRKYLIFLSLWEWDAIRTEEEVSEEWEDSRLKKKSFSLSVFYVKSLSLFFYVFSTAVCPGGGWNGSVDLWGEGWEEDFWQALLTSLPTLNYGTSAYFLRKKKNNTGDEILRRWANSGQLRVKKVNCPKMYKSGRRSWCAACWAMFEHFYAGKLSHYHYGRTSRAIPPTVIHELRFPPAKRETRDFSPPKIAALSPFFAHFSR